MTTKGLKKGDFVLYKNKEKCFPARVDEVTSTTKARIIPFEYVNNIFKPTKSIDAYRKYMNIITDQKVFDEIFMKSILCLPVEKYRKKWRLLDEMGSGRYTNTYGVCAEQEDGSCIYSYVLKFILFSDNYRIDQFNREVKLQNKIASLGFSVPVEDFWTCESPLLGHNNEEMGAIVMKILDITVRNFLNNKNITEEDFKSVIEGVQSLIDNLHTTGYYHGDPHFGNIMLKKVNYVEANTVLTTLGRFRLYFIDLGDAGPLTYPGYKGIKKMTKEKRILDDRHMFEEELKEIIH